MRFTFYVSLVGLFFMSGCVSTHESYMDNYIKAKENSVSIHNLKSKIVNFGSASTITIGGTDCDCLEIDGEKSFAQKLELQEKNVPFSLNVKTKVADSAVFAPKILLLDSADNIVKLYTSKEFLYDRGMFKKNIFINNPKDINSIVITHDNTTMDDNKTITSVDINYVYTGYISLITASEDKKIKLKNSIGGIVILTLEKL